MTANSPRATSTALSTTIARPTSIEKLVADVRTWHRTVDREACPGCLGAGGRDERALPPVSGHPTLGEAIVVWGQYCKCAIGQACREAENLLRGLVFKLRDQAVVDHMWRGSGVPPHFQTASIETFPATDQTRPLLVRLAEWLTTDRWLLLWGPFGTGKTGIAVSLFRELLEAGHTGIFQTVPALLDRIRDTYDRDGQRKGEPTERELLTALRDVDVLVLDDLGAERPSPWVAEKLFGLINHRHNHHKRTLITSNLGPDELGDHVGERTVWRVVELADVLHLNGPNLRDRKARGRAA